MRAVLVQAPQAPQPVLLVPCIGPGWVCRGVQSVSAPGSARCARGTIDSMVHPCQPQRVACWLSRPRSRFRIGLAASGCAIFARVAHPQTAQVSPSSPPRLMFLPTCPRHADRGTGGPVLPACGFLVLPWSGPSWPLSTSSETDTTHGGLGGCEWCAPCGRTIPIPAARRGQR